MRLLTRRKTPSEELKDAAIEALVNALDDDKRSAKPRIGGVRALAAGAVIYTAGRAAFKRQRFLREQLSSDTEDDQAEDLEDEEEARAHEEPEAEEYEVDEEDDEPEAVEDDEDSEEPAARREPDDESGSETPTPMPERTPMRQAARKKGAQPSLRLPTQRRPRIRLSKD